MTDRLQKLLRQRALIQEHLAWLDREIADGAGSVPPLPPSAVTKSAASIAPSAPLTAPTPDAAEKILDQYNVDTAVVKTDARRGCLTLFFIGFSIFLLIVGIGYYFYGRHLGRWW